MANAKAVVNNANLLVRNSDLPRWFVVWLMPVAITQLSTAADAQIVNSCLKE